MTQNRILGAIFILSSCPVWAEINLDGAKKWYRATIPILEASTQQLLGLLVLVPVLFLALKVAIIVTYLVVERTTSWTGALRARERSDWVASWRAFMDWKHEPFGGGLQWFLGPVLAFGLACSLPAVGQFDLLLALVSSILAVAVLVRKRNQGLPRNLWLNLALVFNGLLLLWTARVLANRLLSPPATLETNRVAQVNPSGLGPLRGQILYVYTSHGQVAYCSLGQPPYVQGETVAFKLIPGWSYPVLTGFRRT